jgi:hypothetical protein
MLKWIRDIFRARTPEEQRQAEFSRLYDRWMVSCHKRGLTPKQQSHEFQFRVAWVRFRRRVTEAAIAWPEGYQQKISDIARDETKTLALYDKAVAKQFLNVVETADLLSEILYPDGKKAVMSRKIAMYMRPIENDYLDALRTRW